jgi:hypothetical protein
LSIGISIIDFWREKLNQCNGGIATKPPFEKIVSSLILLLQMSKTLIRFDWAVKKLLRNKANFGILEGFLSELLFDEIRIQRILESESNQETGDDKFNRVDILTENSKNELIIVEIQNTYEIDYFQRMAYGASKALAENFYLGQQ